MTYEEFCKEYVAIIKEGCDIAHLTLERRLSLGEKYADLVEAYPEYEDRADNDPSLWEWK